MPSDARLAATKTIPSVFAPSSAHRNSSVESVPLWSGVRRALSHWFHRDHGADLISEAPGAASATLGRRTEVSPRQPSLPPQRDDDPAPAFVRSYFGTLDRVWQAHDWTNVVALTETLQRVWRENRQVFLCGNGGSAANAIHLANDFLYGVDKKTGRGLRVTALPANGAVLTCLANDVSYEDVFAQQLTVLANRGDVLIALSGSGNSPNILKALTRARELGVETFAILGFTGGRALGLADHPIYFPVHDMQVAEDLQMMVGHMAMQWLSRQPR